MQETGENLPLKGTDRSKVKTKSPCGSTINGAFGSTSDTRINLSTASEMGVVKCLQS